MTVFIVIATFLIIAGIGLVNSLKYTEHGTLHINAAILLKYIELSKTDLFADGKTPAEIRVVSATGGSILKGKPTPVEHIRDTTFPGPAGLVPIRIYTPQTQTKVPVIIYFHGGGWVIGSLDSHDNLCRSLATKSSSIVISVDYRLAPEHAYPAAIEDAYAALLWTYKNAATINGDSARILVLGDSAGGNLAAAVALMARDKNGPDIYAQILIYPAVNLAEFNTESHRKFGKGFYLTKRYMEKFRSLYLPQTKDWKDIYVSPLLAGSLINLPPAMVLTAELDVLRTEGEAYALRLKNAGVPTRNKRYLGMIHGFVNMDRLFGQSEIAIDDISDFIRELPSL